MTAPVPDLAVALRPADEAAAVLEPLYRSHYAELVRLAGFLTDNREEAEEVVQEAFAGAWMAWRRVRRHDDPLPYLRRAVMNQAKGRLRRRRTARSAVMQIEISRPGADSDVLAEQQRARVRAAVRTLPDRQRECVLLRHLAGCSTAETAATLGISEGSVKTHLHRARASLAALLEEDR